MINIIEKKDLVGTQSSKGNENHESNFHRYLQQHRSQQERTTHCFFGGISAMLANAHCGIPGLILQGVFRQNSSQTVSKPLFLFPVLSQPFSIEARTSYFLTTLTPHDPAPQCGRHDAHNQVTELGKSRDLWSYITAHLHK